MKQVQSETIQNRSAARRWPGKSSATGSRRRTDRPYEQPIEQLEHASAWSLGQLLVVLVAGVWFMATLPFRLVFSIFAWLGRLTAVVLGFSLMVVGMAFWAGPLFFIGIPLFLLGLVLTLRSLD